MRHERGFARRAYFFARLDRVDLAIRPVGLEPLERPGLPDLQVSIMKIRIRQWMLVVEVITWTWTSFPKGEGGMMLRIVLQLVALALVLRSRRRRPS